MKKIKKGQVWFVDLKHTYSNITHGAHPVVVLGNWMANTYSPVVTVVVMTSFKGKKGIPTHVLVKNDFLKKDSIVCPEQITTISRDMFVGEPLGKLDDIDMKRIQSAVISQLGLAS